jgi:hypothetical protein
MGFATSGSSISKWLAERNLYSASPASRPILTSWVRNFMKMMKALQFLDRYLLRALAGLACVLGLTGAVAGYFTGIRQNEYTMLAIVSCIAGLIAFIPRSDSSFHMLPRKKREPYVSPYTVQFDDEAITVTLKNKKGEKSESVRWADLAVVGITIVDTYLPEPYWTLAGMPGTGGCIYSNSAIGAKELLRAL